VQAPNHSATLTSAWPLLGCKELLPNPEGGQTAVRADRYRSTSQRFTIAVESMFKDSFYSLALVLLAA
jgi:hypothetical protein